MSDILKKLEQLKKKKKKQPLESPQKSDPPQKTDPEKQATLDKLRNLIANVKTPETPAADVNNTALSVPGINRGLLTEEFLEGPGQSIEDLVPGEIIETPSGPCFRVRTEYPWHHYQGSVSLFSLFDQDTTGLKYICTDTRYRNPDFYKTLFFDTETTGLDTGSGVYIFMAGFGYFQDRSFIVDQFFMRDFPEEPAVLDAISDLMSRFDTLVSYNGRTYDWPLIETRFTANRRKLPMTDPPHFDLLTATRRLYRFRLENCKLTSVEEGILGFHRVDDMPGALMPDLYFKYLRSRDARFIHQAFAHNSHDIVSMAAILSEMLRFLSCPPEDGGAAPGPDLYAFGRMLDNAGEMSPAEEQYRSALQSGLEPEIYRDALRRLSLMLKRHKRWDDALELWRLMIRTITGFDLFPYLEIAKYLEHQQKDFDEAHRIVCDAVEKHDSHCPFDHATLQELKYRKKRIETKRSGGKWQPGKSLDPDIDL